MIINKRYFALARLFFFLFLIPAANAGASNFSDSKTITVSIRIPPAIKTSVQQARGSDGQEGYALCVAGRGVKLYSLHLAESAAGLNLRGLSSGSTLRLRPGKYSPASRVHSSSLNNCQKSDVLITRDLSGAVNNSGAPVSLMVVAE